jgi:hypothetical protein
MAAAVGWAESADAHALLHNCVTIIEKVRHPLATIAFDTVRANYTLGHTVLG